MKKILAVFSVLLALLMIFSYLQFAQTMAEGSLLYQGKTSIAIYYKQDVTKAQIYNAFLAIKEKYGVDSSIYANHNAKSISIYTTNPTLDSRLPLAEGKYPAFASEDFFSNKTTKSPHQSGRVHFMAKDFILKVYPLKNVERLGGYNAFVYLDTCDQEKLDKIVKELSTKLGDVQVRSVYGYHGGLIAVMESLAKSPIQGIVLTLCLFLFSLLLIYYVISKGKMVSILSLHGYSFGKMTRQVLTEFTLILVGSWLVTSLLIVPSAGFFVERYYTLHFVLVNTLLHLTLLGYAGALITCFLFIQKKCYSPYALIKGKKPFAFLMSLQLLIKLILLGFIVFCFNSIHADSFNFQQQIAANAIWQNAENVYCVMTNFVTNDFGKKRQLELRAKMVYQDLEKDNGLFLIRTHNYENFIEFCKEKGKNPDTTFSPSRNILVNPNYLKRHPVYTIDSHQSILDQLDYAENTINLLVPAHLKNHEDELISYGRETIHFYTVEVPNIYNKEFHLPLNQTPSEALKVNLIYIEDNIRHFTYNNSVESNHHNQIQDPIIIVDTGNFDPSCYFSYLTSSCYFETSATEPLETIVPAISRHNMSASYQSVFAVYGERAEEIRALKRQIQLTSIFEVFLLIGFAIAVISFHASYYEKNKYAIYIKRILGYSKLQINQWNFIANCLLSASLLLFLTADPKLKITLFALEVLIMCLCNFIIFQKTFQRVIKGEH